MATRGFSSQKDELQRRLAKIEGQVRGLRRMFAEDAYCIDVLTQVNATTTALRAVGVGLLDGHVRHCVRNTLTGGTDGDEKVDGSWPRSRGSRAAEGGTGQR